MIVACNQLNKVDCNGYKVLDVGLCTPGYVWLVSCDWQNAGLCEGKILSEILIANHRRGGDSSEELRATVLQTLEFRKSDTR